MTIKAIVITAAITSALIGGAGAGGYFYATYQSRHEALAQNCAHYDQRTGDFTWGSAGIYIAGAGDQLEDSAIDAARHASLLPPPKPQKKTKH